MFVVGKEQHYVFCTGIRKLVMEVFQNMWFTPVKEKPSIDKDVMIRKVMNITDVVAASEDMGLEWFEQLLVSVSIALTTFSFHHSNRWCGLAPSGTGFLILSCARPHSDSFSHWFKCSLYFFYCLLTFLCL